MDDFSLFHESSEEPFSIVGWRERVSATNEENVKQQQQTNQPMRTNRFILLFDRSQGTRNCNWCQLIHCFWKDFRSSKATKRRWAFNWISEILRYKASKTLWSIKLCKCEIVAVPLRSVIRIAIVSIAVDLKRIQTNQNSKCLAERSDCRLADATQLPGKFCFCQSPDMDLPILLSVSKCIATIQHTASSIWNRFCFLALPVWCSWLRAI